MLSILYLFRSSEVNFLTNLDVPKLAYTLQMLEIAMTIKHSKHIKRNF
jgi:hypothetical protein